jgi:hypothetical protein
MIYGNTTFKNTQLSFGYIFCKKKTRTKLSCFSPQANYTDRATAAYTSILYNSTSWDIMLRSPENQYTLRGRDSLSLQSGRESEARNQHRAKQTCSPLPALLFDLEDRGDASLTRRVTYTEQYGVIGNCS